MVDKAEDKNKKEEGLEKSKSPKKGFVKPLVGSIRTYANDISKLVSKGVSLTDVALSEQKRRLAQPVKMLKKMPKVEKEDRTYKIIISIAIVFIVLGVSAIVFSFFFKEKVDPQIAELNVYSLIFANNQEELAILGLDRAKIIKKISQSRTSIQIQLGSIANLYITDEVSGVKRLVRAGEFLEKIEVSAESAFIRSLGDRFMLGVHSFDGNKVFLLFEVNSFDNAFAEMLNWERFLLDDLWVMFYNQKPQAKTFSGEEGSIFNEGFRDVITKNRDTRVLKDENNETIFVYSFPDRKHLVIATDENTLIEVLSRLTTGRFKN